MRKKLLCGTEGKVLLRWILITFLTNAKVTWKLFCYPKVLSFFLHLAELLQGTIQGVSEGF